MENCVVYNKWNALAHRYDPYYVPADKKLVFYDTDLEDIVNCCQCLKEIKYGDSYTSLEVHTEIGTGYAVCESCYSQEIARREKLTRREEQKYVCCICGKEFIGYGNNPAPVKESGRCCDECNATIVVPTRIEQWK